MLGTREIVQGPVAILCTDPSVVDVAVEVKGKSPGVVPRGGVIVTRTSRKFVSPAGTSTLVCPKTPVIPVGKLPMSEYVSLTFPVLVTFTTGGQQETFPITLPPVSVVSGHVLSLTPTRQSIDPGEGTAFTVEITNPLGTDETFNLTAVGLGEFETTLAPSVAIPAGQTVTTPLSIDSAVNALAGAIVFTVKAEAVSGFSDHVEGQLIVSNTPITTEISADALGVVLGLLPPQATAGQGTSTTYVARVEEDP